MRVQEFREIVAALLTQIAHPQCKEKTFQRDLLAFLNSLKQIVSTLVFEKLKREKIIPFEMKDVDRFLDESIFDQLDNYLFPKSVDVKALLGDEVDSLAQERLTLGERDVLRFLTTAENAGVQTAQAIYLFNETGKLWVIGFFTNQAQIDQRRPTFDAAVASFAVQPAE